MTGLLHGSSALMLGFSSAPRGQEAAREGGCDGHSHPLCPALPCEVAAVGGQGRGCAARPSGYCDPEPRAPLAGSAPVGRCYPGHHSLAGVNRLNAILHNDLYELT